MADLDEDWIEPFLTRLGGHGIGQAERDALSAALVDTRSYRRGQTVVRENDEGEPLHLILQGWAARCQILKDGSRQITDFILPGELCDLSRLHGGATDITIALTPLRVALLSRVSVLAAMNDYPELANALLRLAFSEQAILRAWVVCLGRREKREHVAHLLCELHERLRGAHLVTDGEFDLPLTQNQLADTVGMTTVHTNRVLQQLRKEGIISWGQQHLTIHQPAKLREVGEFDPAYLKM